MKNLRHLLRRVTPSPSPRGLDGRSRSRKSDRVGRPRAGKRRLLSEALESRQLLAGDVPGAVAAEADTASSEIALAHNYWNRFDVNNDKAITALDALTVINHINRASPSGEMIASRGEFQGFVDVNADHQATALDALQVINDINANDTRWLTFQESLTSWVDVNNDGRVSALDALVVINRLNAEQFAGAGEGEPHPLNKDSAAATDNPAPIAPPPVAMPEAIVNAERSQTISVNAGSVNAAEVDVHSPQPAKSLVGAEGEDVWIVSPGTPHFDPVIRRAADLAILDWLDDEESNHPADVLTHLVEQSLVDDGRSHKS